MRIPTPKTLGGLTAALALAVPTAALAGPATSFAGQEPSRADAGAREQEQDSSKALKRIVHLRGGTSLRCIARRTEGGWEYKKNGGWSPLPDAAVERVALERDVSAELRKREKAVGKDDQQARTELAGWALENGLLGEGLGAADRVLASDPDHAGARAVVMANAHRFRVPPVVTDGPAEIDAAAMEAACDALLRWAAQRSASSRELAVLELAKVEYRTALEAALANNLFASTPGRRGFSAFALKRLFPGKQVKPLLSRAVLDVSPAVRADASRALGAAGQPGLVVPVARAMMNSRSPRVQIQAAEALGNMGYAAAVQPLVAHLASLQGTAPGHSVPHSNIFIGRQFAYIQDFDVEVAQFQAVADPQVNVLIEGQVTDAGVIAVKELVTAIRGSIKGSLGQLTGASPGRTSRAWLNWWEENDGEWLAAKHAGVETPNENG